MNLKKIRWNNPNNKKKRRSQPKNKLQLLKNLSLQFNSQQLLLKQRLQFLLLKQPQNHLFRNQELLLQNLLRKTVILMTQNKAWKDYKMMRKMMMKEILMIYKVKMIKAKKKMMNKQTLLLLTKANLKVDKIKIKIKIRIRIKESLKIKITIKTGQTINKIKINSMVEIREDPSIKAIIKESLSINITSMVEEESHLTTTMVASPSTKEEIITTSKEVSLSIKTSKNIDMFVFIISVYNWSYLLKIINNNFRYWYYELKKLYYIPWVFSYFFCNNFTSVSQ